MKSRLSIALTLALCSSVFELHPATWAQTQVLFQEHQSIPTSGAFDWHYFTIGSDLFLALANNNDNSGADSKVYRWDGAEFREYQLIPTDGARDWEYFTSGTDSFLVVANNRPWNTDSIVYKWDGTFFVSDQSIPTVGARDWEHFTIGSDSFLVVANSFDGSTNDIDSKIYRWDGASFREYQSLPTHRATDWEFFKIGTDSYLAVANRRSDATANVDSLVYKWDPASAMFVEFQAIPTSGAWDWEFFTIGADSYLAVANRGNDTTLSIDSKIYRWNGTMFVEFQVIPTHGARDWEYFTAGGDSFLAVANGTGPIHPTSDTDSKIFQWDGTTFVGYQDVPTMGAIDWESFTIGGASFLAVANSLSDNNHNVDSKIYRAVFPDPDPGTGRRASVVLPLGSSGMLSVTPQDVVFPNTSIAGQDVIALANDATWTAADTTNQGRGWHVTLAATDHLRGNSDPVNHVILVGQSQGFMVECLDSEVVTVSGAAANPPFCPPGAQPIPLDTESPLSILIAGPLQGMGVYDFLPHFEILVPGTTVIDTYSTEIFTDIMAGP